MHKIRNTQAGPRGIFAGDETVMLAPGEERELDVSAGDMKSAKASGWFAIDGKAAESEEPVGFTDNPATTPPPAPPADRFDAMSEADLRAFIEERDGKKPGPNTGRDKLLTAARG